MSTDHSRRGMGAEDYCTCDRPWPCSLAAEALDALRERVAVALYDGNEAFHAALASDRGQEYRRIDRPSWADTDEYYRALYRARADAALAALDDETARLREKAWDEGAFEGLRTPRGFDWTLVKNPYRAALDPEEPR